MLRAPLSVRIDDGTTERHVTPCVTGLSFKKTAPGGFHSAQMTLNMPLDTFSDLSGADRIWVYGPNGRVLWEGFLDNPGRSDGRDGQSFALTAMGTIVLAGDQATALPYLLTDLTQFEQNKASTTSTSANAQTSDDPTAVSGGEVTQGLLCQFNPGQPVDVGYVVQTGYSGLANAGLDLGAVTFTIKDGKTDAGYQTDFITSAGAGTAVVDTIGTGISTAVRGPFVRYGGTGGAITATHDRLAFQLRRTGAATNIADDNTWSFFYDVVVAALRKNKAGVDLTAAEMAAQSASVVRADWVVADMVGRLLSTIVDPDAVTIGAASYLIDQLAYTDPVTMADVLDDLELYEPDFFWEFVSATNGFGFTYRQWPTEPRYEITTRDGYEAPGADVDLCNRIAVNWVDKKGRDRVTVVHAASSLAANPLATVFSADLAALEASGRTRDAEAVTLGAELGSAANAQRIGEQVLAARAMPPKAATATIRRPVVDLLLGGTAMPYELEPGYLVLVRDTGDLLRLTEVDYDDDSGNALMTLGTPQLTVEQRVARLSKSKKGRR